ncbi:MAG TPA: F0F1 ATP synthase subunit epsilon [Planctomycetaceae bacterium]|nr:F0F1 ATP synthase subunit epsilon [Planctomycetaceae bacterium]
MSTAGKELRLVVVTPETTVLDQPVQALRFPLYDGQIGVLPGRAPLVGRLGYGELKVTTAEGDRSYFIDGGFVQVKGAVVSILTARSIPADQIDVDEAQQQLAQAFERRATTEAELAAKHRDLERARRLRALGQKSMA